MERKTTMFERMSLARVIGLVTPLILVFTVLARLSPARADAQSHRLLYVALPGVRNNLEYGGHGLAVFDIDDSHRFVKRIPTGGLDENGRPLNVKGVCASAATGRVYISTLQHLICLDLRTEKVLWEHQFDAGCDRMAISPDGQLIYLPSLEGPLWYVVDGMSGKEITRVVTSAGAHNTVYGLDGREAYLAGRHFRFLMVTDPATHTVVREVGPFGEKIRPFTVNGRQTLCFVNVDNLLGFEIADLKTGKLLHRITVPGFEKGPVKRHGCPSHGIGLTPDEREIWVTDAYNRRVHIYDATVMPPDKVADVELKDEPGWITFSLDGKLAWPSTGDVIDTQSRKIITSLTDENGQSVQSEKMVEIQFENGRLVRAGDQFGVGRVTDPVP